MPEDDQTDRFDNRYRVTGDSVFLEIERAVLGVDYQATGYTTRSEADELGQRLELGPASRLLDLGSGCGFPGLYLATRTGCSVVTVDPIATGAAAARARARKDGLADHHHAVVARGQALPVRSASFDAIVHVDVTCWIRQKLSVLRACRSALKPGGIMAFTVIEPASGLAPTQRRNVADVGPPGVLVRTSYPSLLDSAGFVDVTAEDVTAAYRSTIAAWLDETGRRADAVVAVMGASEFDERQRRRTDALAAVDAGVLRRWLYVALRGRRTVT